MDCGGEYICACLQSGASCEAADAARAGVDTTDSIRTHCGFDDDECCGRRVEAIDDLAVMASDDMPIRGGASISCGAGVRRRCAPHPVWSIHPFAAPRPGWLPPSAADTVVCITRDCNRHPDAARLDCQSFHTTILKRLKQEPKWLNTTWPSSPATVSGRR